MAISETKYRMGNCTAVTSKQTGKPNKMSHTSNSEGYRFSQEELTALRTLFDSCDATRSGRIHINQLPGLLGKLGKDEDEVANITETCSRIAENQEGQLRFNDLISVLERMETTTQTPFEGPDPKVIEFLRILEEYRVKCEEEGNYLEAGRAHKQLGILRKQEEKRQQKAILARQISERQDVQLAHNMQFSDFNAAWDKYMDEYDNMAQQYIQQMTERHAVVLLEFQKHVRQELASKPPKWSRELLEQRRKQHINARNKNYTDAQKLKKVCDKIEEKERQALEQEQAIIFARRDAKFRQHQQAELQALLKRIECRRKEHIKQRNLDSKRLLQRNRNVQTVLESKQGFESHRLFDSIKKTLHSNPLGGGGNNGGSSSPGGVRQASPAAGATRESKSRQKQHRNNMNNNNNNNNNNNFSSYGLEDAGNNNNNYNQYNNDYSGYENNNNNISSNNNNGEADIAFDLPFLQHSGPTLVGDHMG